MQAIYVAHSVLHKLLKLGTRVCKLGLWPVSFPGTCGMMRASSFCNARGVHVEMIDDHESSRMSERHAWCTIMTLTYNIIDSQTRLGTHKMPMT